VALSVQRARAHAEPGLLIQVECDTVAQARVAIAAGADALLLDNMPNHALRECVDLAKGHCWTEASGGVSLETVRGIAETGVDRISVGALTHSAPSLDLALDFE
jgi:nicotinate-nucleotide pyrophosphorylase (carboxylating)